MSAIIAQPPFRDARAKRFASIFRNAPESVLRNCVLAWHPRMGSYATLGPKYGYQRLAGTYSGGARMVRDRWAGILRPFPTNTMPITGVQEPGATNLFKNSQDFSAATWTRTCSVDAEYAVAPDGTTTADRMYPASGERNYAFGTLDADSNYCVSVFAKGLSSPSVVDWVSYSFYDGNLFENSYYRWDTQEWVVAGGTLPVVNSGIQALPNNWYRLWRTYTTSSSPSAGGSFSFIVGTSAGEQTVWGAQLEKNSFPTSYIPTTTDPVARAADAFRFTSTLFDSVKSQGSLLVVMRAQHDVVDLAEDVGYIALTDSGDYATDGIRAAQLMSGDGDLYIESYESTTASQSNVSQAPVPGAYNALAFSWDANGGNCFRVLSGSAAALSLSRFPTSLDGIEIGSDASANARNGFDYALAAVFDRPLTEAELVSLTLNPERYVGQAA